MTNSRDSISPPQRAPVKPIALLGLIALAGVGFWAGFGKPWWQQHCANRQVQLLAKALNLYALDLRAYPKGGAAEVAALLRSGLHGAQSRQRADYADAITIETNATGEFVDPWGTPYQFVSTVPARVYSLGPNRQDDNAKGDDITSWDRVL